MDYLNQVGAIITVVLGIVGLVAPQVVAKFVSLTAVGLTGKAELRATYGGFFLALGLACIVLGSTEVYRVVGVAWLGAAVGRLVSVVVDRSYSPKNIGGVLFEAAIGGALVA